MSKKFKIAFIGPDESGKTTLLNILKEDIKKDGKEADFLFMGWRDFYNPLLRLFSKVNISSKKNNKDIKGERIDRYKSRSWFFYLIYYSELWMRYLKVFFSDKEYFLFDRYFYDELLFSEDIKFNFFSKITPKPDLCVVLKPPFKTLEKRKQKVTKEKLNYFYSKLEKISKLCDYIELDTSEKPERTYSKLKKSIIKILKKQDSSRY